MSPSKQTRYLAATEAVRRIIAAQELIDSIAPGVFRLDGLAGGDRLRLGMAQRQLAALRRVAEEQAARLAPRPPLAVVGG